MVYDLLDDWNDPQNPEANFGLVRNPSSQSGVLAPKPAFTTMAVLTRQLQNRVFDRRDSVPQGAYSLVFTDASGGALRVMWATAPTARHDQDRRGSDLRIGRRDGLLAGDSFAPTVSARS
ncbi:hypothetical protein [Agromyces albus]|uniref:hypothetical protein n=1 Tax=Agromyces albus TaxID=205332 RepID=UPI0027818C85|nr:hypothetical protein [Agromyces albus]MDQ0576231.1 hypothetical protein [Agromyces albus]